MVAKQTLVSVLYGFDLREDDLKIFQMVVGCRIILYRCKFPVTRQPDRAHTVPVSVLRVCSLLSPDMTREVRAEYWEMFVITQPPGQH